MGDSMTLSGKTNAGSEVGPSHPDHDVETLELNLPHRSVELLCVGPEEGEAVFLLHGFPDGPESMVPLCYELATAGYRCYAPTMPGYSWDEQDTDLPGHLDFLSEDLSQQLEVLGLEEVVLVGSDWGAMTAYVTAVKAPERVRLCVMLALPPRRVFVRNLLSNPGQIWRQRYVLLFLLPGIAEWWLRRRDGEYLRSLWARWEPSPTAQRFEPRVRKRVLSDATLSAALGYYRALFVGWLWNPSGFWRSWHRSTRRCEVPGLILAGREDGCIEPSMFEGSCQAFEAPCRMRVLDDGGHFLHAANPEAVAEEIHRFLTEVPHTNE